MNQVSLKHTRADGKATTTRSTFRRETSVGIEIHSDPAIVWALLTNASDYPRWNSTIVSLEGEIREGERIKLKSTLDQKRTFTLKVEEFIPEKHMVWGGGQGKRTYTIEELANNRVIFRMSEKIGSPLFPLFARYIPPFDESFEQFASDVKKEAEAIQNG